jgi:hypothetical protein
LPRRDKVIVAVVVVDASGWLLRLEKELLRTSTKTEGGGALLTNLGLKPWREDRVMPLIIPPFSPAALPACPDDAAA